MPRKKATTSKPYDVAFKHLFEARPRDALSLIHMTDAIDVRLLEAELSTTVAAADKVLHVRRPAGELLVHFEFQSGCDSKLTERLFWYNAALYHRHELPVLSVVVLLAPAADHASLTGTHRVLLPDGREVLVFRYEVIRLWQTPVATVLTGPLGLLPLAPLCAGADAIDAVIGQMDRRIQRESTRDESETLWSITYFLLGLRIDVNLARQLIPIGQAMKESVTYQATVEEGRQEGLEKGLAKGLLTEAKKILLRLGTDKLGPPSRTFKNYLATLDDLALIESLIVRVAQVTSWDELLPPRKARPKKP